MSLHFVTSAQAEDHVSSSDEARKTEGMIGTGGFVLGTKDKLSASMIDANTLRILEGDIIFCGRQVNITNYEEVTIQNGTPGMNSIALVVLNMKTDPSEEATIKVYEGTETDGDPVMPEYIEGDLNNGDTEAEMPLYAITKTGLSVGDPVAQFDIWVSEKEFRTSIDHTIINSWHVYRLPNGLAAIVRNATMNVQADEQHGDMYYHGYTQPLPGGILSEVLYADVRIAKASGLWGTSLQRATTSQLSYYATCSTQQSSVEATFMFLILGVVIP
jgi:hypothetical protein